MHSGTVNQCREKRNGKFYLGKVITSVFKGACGLGDVPGRQFLQSLELRRVAKAGGQSSGVITVWVVIETTAVNDIAGKVYTVRQ